MQSAEASEQISQRGIESVSQNIDGLHRISEQVEAITRELEELQGILIGTGDALAAEAETSSRLHSAVIDAYGAAEKAWVYTDLPDGADAKYREAVQALTAAVREWKTFKARWEGRYATAVETVAARIATLSPDASRAMKELAAKLRAKGCESFGES